MSVVGGLEVIESSRFDFWGIVGRYVQAGAGIVARFPDGCAYPQTNHYCQGDVLSDIMRSWQDGNQSYQPEADPDDELDGQGS